MVYLEELIKLCIIGIVSHVAASTDFCLPPVAKLVVRGCPPLKPPFVLLPKKKE
jgi:hypothetical protein